MLIEILLENNLNESGGCLGPTPIASAQAPAELSPTVTRVVRRERYRVTLPRMSYWTRLKGKFVRPIAEAAGDRHAEAKAHLEASTGTEPEPAAVDEAQDDVRKRHHDIPEP